MIAWRARDEVENLHQRTARPTAAGRNELLQAGLFTFGFDLHASIGHIAHKSRNTKFSGLLPGEIPESHALNPSPYRYLTGFFHISYFQQQIYITFQT